MASLDIRMARASQGKGQSPNRTHSLSSPTVAHADRLTVRAFLPWIASTEPPRRDHDPNARAQPDRLSERRAQEGQRFVAAEMGRQDAARGGEDEPGERDGVSAVSGGGGG
jgi:hypothetical protein